MDIESLLNIDTMVLKNRFVLKFIYNGKPITELRMLKTNDLMKTALETLYKNEIKNVCFVFIVDSLEMPTNIKLFKDFASTFHSHVDIIQQKLDFTIIQSNSGVFKLFFSILKMYYQPIKPLYISESSESTKKCLMSRSERSKTTNFSDEVKKY